MSTIAARIKDERLIERLKKISAETERPMSYHVEKALKFYLDEYADLLIARERLVDPGEKYFSIDEAKEKLGL